MDCIFAKHFPLFLFRVVISVLHAADMTSDHVSGDSDWFSFKQLRICIGQNKPETFWENNNLLSDFWCNQCLQIDMKWQSGNLWQLMNENWELWSDDLQAWVSDSEPKTIVTQVTDKVTASDSLIQNHGSTVRRFGWKCRRWEVF